jgi:uncharacterized protein YaiE (UPF0345 family)
MKLLSPEVICENTRETDVQELQTGHWAISASASGTTSFSGSFGYEPRVSTSSIAFREYGVDATFTFYTTKPSRVHTVTVSNYQSVKKSHWLSMMSGSVFSVMSAPLTEEELTDIHRGIEEIRLGKAKHFKTVRETIEWLHRERER